VSLPVRGRRISVTLSLLNDPGACGTEGVGCCTAPSFNFCLRHIVIAQRRAGLLSKCAIEKFCAQFTPAAKLSRKIIAESSVRPINRNNKRLVGAR
jgi:hypothetical protein